MLLYIDFLSQSSPSHQLEYRVWNPFRSKLAAAILGGVDAIHMPPGSKVELILSNSNNLRLLPLPLL